MRRLILDAGPLIGLFHKKDSYHEQCVDGFTQLAAMRVVQLIPLPIAFEVYKWLLQHEYPSSAQRALREMEESFSLIPLDNKIFTGVQSTVAQLPDWKGSLEDTTVVIMALRYSCPAWTYNYRDFSLFESLSFWNPR